MKFPTVLAVLFFFAILFSIKLSSAIVVNSVDVETFSPGKEGTIRIELENILNDDVEDVSLSLKFANLPFIPVGSSEQSVDEIEEDDDETFVFRIRSSPSATPGNYEIPYVLEYIVSGDDSPKTRNGGIGVQVEANPILDYSVSTENAIVGRQGTINLRIVNKGFFDARFVSVRILPEGFTVLSDENVYIGTVDSDDFENADFDVKFTRQSPSFLAIVEYVNFDNERIIDNIEIPLRVYTEERALELGLIQPSPLGTYIAAAVTLILLIVLWRFWRRRQRSKRRQRLQEKR